jgi:tetratricopeptide (TPR) repeat protein
LVSHDLNFSLDRLQGGQPRDPWYVRPHLWHDLWREYRRLAERELRLGRHRRAAYIFAELVGDLAGAAAALAAGGHFREAAVLYRDRLHQPLEAARCLEQGGLWAEALEAYEELQEFEKAGDLARKLEQEDDATRLYRLKVKAALVQDDFLAAARVLDQKLASRDEALGQLLAGWHSMQQKQCISEAFRLWGAAGRHEEAESHIARLSGPDFPPATWRNFINNLAEIARSYPDAPVRASLGDAVRVMAAARLKVAVPDESRTLLSAVRHLAPEDRLLERDCQRYLDQAPRPLRHIPPLDRRAVATAVLVKDQRIAEAVQCFAAAASDDWFYVAGYGPGDTFSVFQGSFIESDRKTSVRWPIAATAWHAPVILVPDWTVRTPANQRLLIVHLVNVAGENLTQKSLPENSYWRLPVGSPPWATRETLAIAEAGNGMAWALNRSHGGLVLNGYTSKNVPVASLPIELPPALVPIVENPVVLPIPMHVRESTFYIGLGDRLVIVHRERSAEFIEMPYPIRGLACSPPHTRRRVAVTFDSGGRVIWDESPESHEEPFATDLNFPVAGFVRSGWLVAASCDECEVYSTNERRARLHATCKLPRRVPLAIFDTGASAEFALSFDDGTILTYRMPPRA